MSKCLNSVQLSGRIGTELDARRTGGNKLVVNFRLAVNEGDKEATWVDVTAWERAAEILTEYRKKGDYLIITGKLQQDSWEDRETGEKRYRLRVVTTDVVFIPGGGGGEGAGRGYRDE